ncbi:putative cellulase (glycosyl hydrolase family 5) [Lyophyllum shimeji]|uniref:Cellulase (Glycosyl hydrolase family 5) n=1 Tax=Lyophyllum shimeji TaxID=47721 RepID=A0A9P3PQ75_LYOSH|nr:putative cellulase (glycosyl hydrolase family 5) [Lyophyllum shimeji]
MSARSDLDASFVIVGDNTGAKNAEEKPVANEVHPSNSKSYLPGSVPVYAHDWSVRGTGQPLRIHGRHFVDGYGRVCGLRGVNLSGCCKAPVNDNHDTFPAGHESVTFVGRPFPLEEAHEHFSRLRRWGLTFIRFLVTWEAIEHAGPGIYDMEYLTYVRKLLSLLPQYGMTAFVSIHQDVWSRYSGGSGAPAWTLELAGFDLEALEETGAAWLAGVKGGGHVDSERGVWPCGYTKLAAATMATLFWAGDTFAPRLLVKDKDGKSVPIQQFLQNAYLAMSELLARTVGDLDGVLGFEMMNEPHRGYIDLQSFHSWDYNTDLHLSYYPTALQSFQLGAGHPTEVAVWTRSFPMPTRKTSHSVLNPAGRKVWRPDGPSGGKCIWEMHDVWGWDVVKNEGVVLREHYFMKNPVTGKKIDWYTDFYYPFLRKWTERVRGASSPEKMIFVEPIPNEYCPKSWTPEHQVPNMVYAPHWYDLNALFAKAFGNFTVNVQGLSRGMFPLKAFYWGQRGARDNFALQIRNLVEHGYSSLGEKPFVIGECGIPMDMNKKEAFVTEDFTWQTRMMDAMMTALERSLVGFTLWTYNPSNNDQIGDDWNGENFSWFSSKRALPPSLLYYDQDARSLDNGGRILPAVVRPYPAKTAGIPLKFEYEMSSGAFTFEWGNTAPESERDDIHPIPTVEAVPRSGHPKITALETEIFLPSLITLGRKVVVDGLDEADSYVHDERRQTLFIVARDTDPKRIHSIRVSLDPPLTRAFVVNDFWSDFGSRIVALVLLLLGVLAFALLGVYGP